MILSVITTLIAIFLLIKSIIVLSEVNWLLKANKVTEVLWAMIKRNDLGSDAKMRVAAKHQDFFYSPKKHNLGMVGYTPEYILVYFKKVIKNKAAYCNFVSNHDFSN